MAAPPKALSLSLDAKLAATTLHQVLTSPTLMKADDRFTLSSSVGGAANDPGRARGGGMVSQAGSSHPFCLKAGEAPPYRTLSASPGLNLR